MRITFMEQKMYYFRKYMSDGYRWSFVAPNGRKMADSGEGYNNKADRDDAIKLCKKRGELSYSVYRSSGLFYWRARSANGRIIADGSEGYYNETDCSNGAAKFRDEAPDASERDDD